MGGQNTETFSVVTFSATDTLFNEGLLVQDRCGHGLQAEALEEKWGLGRGHFIHSPLQPVTMEPLLLARYCAGLWGILGKINQV